MAKRKPSKKKRPELAIKANLSAKRYGNLKREAENARRRLRRFSDSSEASNYFVPDADDYKLASLIERISLGEKYSLVISELRNLTAEKIKTGVPQDVITNSGYKLKPSEYKAVRNAVKEANDNIREARKKYSGFESILPNEFSFNDITQNITSADSVRDKINDLALFVPENIVPTAINDEGEAGTKAEYQYYRNILERENERRRRNKELNDPRTQSGYFRQQADYESEEINIDAITDLESLRKRAETWDDPARLYRANLFLANYEKALNMFESVLISSGYYNNVVEERISFIRETINKLYFNEEAITYAATRELNIDIALLYAGGSGELDFSAIYNAWTEIDELYL